MEAKDMQRGERTCVVCGATYVYCPNCKKGDPAETWRFMYDSEECRDIFKICSRFAFGHINAEEAQKKLEKFNITDRTKYAESIRQNLNMIDERGNWARPGMLPFEGFGGMFEGPSDMFEGEEKPENRGEENMMFGENEIYIVFSEHHVLFTPVLRLLLTFEHV